MTDVYQIVTDRIIAQMENGVIPWHKPWCGVAEGAYNRVTGRRYSLLNQFLLTHTGEYASFTQWEKLGGKIRKGEKADIVVFWKWPEERLETNPDEPSSQEKDTVKRNTRPILRYYHVFHISQVDGVAPLPTSTLPYDHEPLKKADILFHDYVRREKIHVQEETSNEAYYSPMQDLIHLPGLNQYEYVEDYYATAFHEAVHSTGHAVRLARFHGEKVAFGSDSYSKEELVAEIGSAALLNMLGIETDATIKNNAAYVQNWLSVLRGDRRFIVSAASQAEKAVHFITGGSCEM